MRFSDRGFSSGTPVRPSRPGCPLVAQLLSIYLRGEEQGLSIWRDAQLVELVSKDGFVVGGNVRSGTSLFQVRASCGVLLAAAGFARNGQMRSEDLQVPGTDWTSTHPNGDTGDVLSEAVRVGGATALLNEACWIPTIKDPKNGIVTHAVRDLQAVLHRRRSDGGLLFPQSRAAR